MKTKIFCILGMLALLASCRHDEMVFPSESEETGGGKGKGGMYVLNEGNMGSNKSTLDYYDFSTGIYHRNIYAERNPNEVMELGDVGNDIAIYGSKLYITVNCSHKVEVLEAATARKIKQIDVANCRFLAFEGGNAYVSSYIGPVGVDPNSPRGGVVRIDTASLTVTGQVEVGYQPEEMAVADGFLFVANSGGYRPPEYDNTITVIDLKTFTPTYNITTEINLHRLKKDRYGNLWATSRGNNADIPSSLIKISKFPDGKYAPAKKFDIACDNFALKGDSLLYFGQRNGKYTYGTLDILSGEELGSFISSTTAGKIIRPYGIAVRPETGNIFITDAKNYVSSGTLYCLSTQGEELWNAKTGDIPTAMAFTASGSNTGEIEGPSTPSPDLSAYISRVFEYRPAPGQFVNVLPLYETGDTYQDILRKCEESICGTQDECISLGGFGGYVTFGFDHMVPNVEGEKDFRLWGNAIWQSEDLKGGSAEPGIVWVSYDANGNGLPDDEWYQLAGSEYNSSKTSHGYTITYTNGNNISWRGSLGDSGVMARNPFHTQSYWPEWIQQDADLSFTGTLLAPNAQLLTGNQYILYSYAYGYADNYPNSFAEENSFDISWAVDAEGNPVTLPGIHFVRVVTGLNQQCGALGESSTEISKARDLHW